MLTDTHGCHQHSREQKEARWEGEVGVRRGKGAGEPPPSHLIQVRSKETPILIQSLTLAKFKACPQISLNRKVHNHCPLSQATVLSKEDNGGLFQTVPLIGPRGCWRTGCKTWQPPGGDHRGTGESSSPQHC